MYLFDVERSGRNPFFINSFENSPEVVWQIKLPQNPIKAPESSCVIDDNGNVYFGCHDGCIYSLDSLGVIRWQFITGSKVYSSPLLHGGRLYFTCNSTDLICLDTSGSLIWRYRSSHLSRFSYFFNLLQSNIVYDYYTSLSQKLINFFTVHAWGSPNILDGKYIICNFFGEGVVAVDIDSGFLAWKTSLGSPSNHLSGVAITSNTDSSFIVATSQSNKIFFIDDKGHILWKRNLKLFFNSWGNPSIDKEEKSIYCSTSFYNKSSYIYKFDFQGSLLWKRKINCGIRGSLSISYSNFILVPGLNGYLFYIDKSNGDVLFSVKIGSSQMGLWTSASIALDNSLIINTKDSPNSGSMIHLDKAGAIIWKHNYGKALSVPVLDRNNFLYSGTWDGVFCKFKI